MSARSTGGGGRDPRITLPQPPYPRHTMTPDQTRARAEFRRILRWIAVVAVLMVIGALVYLRLTGILTLHMVIATVIGVFLSVLIGCGLFAAAFFSSKSGHDQQITDATRRPPPE